MADSVETTIAARPVIVPSETRKIPLSVAIAQGFEAVRKPIAERAGCDDTTVTLLPNQTVQVFGKFVDKLTGDVELIELSSFKLNVMPGCGAIMVSSKERVTIPWRGKGIGKLLQEARMATAKAMGCSVMQCTTVANNERQNALLTHLGWKQIDTFLNPATNHTVIIWTKGIT